MQTIPVANLYFYVCVVILSALRNLQEKIRRLEMEKGHAEQSLHALGKDASQTLLQNEDITPRLLNDQKGPERQRSAQSNLKVSVLIYSSYDGFVCLQMKILELEMKLQEEEYQRKLIQDKANQLQTGLEASRILLQSVSPCRSAKKSKEKKSNTKVCFHICSH
uniref:Cep57 centrosome localisation domain-containing protein n=1 Tax=Neolamprologus brichardi TaxID=32507 RepID=A0A3Q4GPH1_NEOBR